MRRWFDLCLKDEDDGIDAEPPVTFFVQRYDPPDPARKETSGVWRSEASWPPEQAATQTFYLGISGPTGDNQLLPSPAQSPGKATIETDPTVGLQGGLWSGGLPFGLPGEQRPDEARSLSFTSTPFEAPLVIAGNPVLELTVSSSAPTALFVAKLSDVSRDGSSALICRGLLNGSRRDGFANPEPMDPHEQYHLRIEFDVTAWQLERGHRLRLSIAGSDFPNSWPSPELATISVFSGGDNRAELSLPLVLGDGEVTPEFQPPPTRQQVQRALETKSGQSPINRAKIS
jgi:putative CocE/NonD family hydrolase